MIELVRNTENVYLIEQLLWVWLCPAPFHFNFHYIISDNLSLSVSQTQWNSWKFRLRQIFIHILSTFFSLQHKWNANSNYFIIPNFHHFYNILRINSEKKTLDLVETSQVSIKKPNIEVWRHSGFWWENEFPL